MLLQCVVQAHREEACSTVARLHRRMNHSQWIVRLGFVSIYLNLAFYLGKWYYASRNKQSLVNSLVNSTLEISIDMSAPLGSILNNTAVLMNADKLVEIGRLLEQDKIEKVRVIPKNITVEYDPDNGDTFLPGGIYHDLDFKFPWQKKKMPRPVNLTRDNEETLRKVIARFAWEQERKAKENRVEETPINIYHKDQNASKLAAWERWHNSITRHHLYQGDDPVIDEVIHDLRTLDFVDLYQHTGGTQMKLVLTLTNGMRAMFKPMRHPRNVEALPDHFVWGDYERHTAEIAAFHLDRIMGNNRNPPVTGRFLNVSKIMERAPKALRKTFFVSPAGNLCFHGECYIYCDVRHGVCGRPELLEGSLMAYLPPSKLMPREALDHPWFRSFSVKQRVKWVNKRYYCEEVMKSPPYDRGRRMADLMDLAVVDFLNGNNDRHEYESFEDFGANSMNVQLDNGRGCGRSLEDDMLILAPVYQCCLFRYSTLRKLWRFYEGPQHLSDVMRASLATDPVAPVLLERHLLALDRRLKIILKTVSLCIEKNGIRNVIIVDGF